MNTNEANTKKNGFREVLVDFIIFLTDKSILIFIFSLIVTSGIQVNKYWMQQQRFTQETKMKNLAFEQDKLLQQQRQEHEKNTVKTKFNNDLAIQTEREKHEIEITLLKQEHEKYMKSEQYKHEKEMVELKKGMDNKRE
ncbi:hypothetical protein QTN25_010557 [Entamoeba marina]